MCISDLKFTLRTTIKAQALLDFLVELSFLETTPTSEIIPTSTEEETWIMMVEGVINAKGVRVGITTKSPSGQHEKVRSVKLDYPLSNNKAEYEALIIGMQWALDAGVSSLIVFCDSQVVVG